MTTTTTKLIIKWIVFVTRLIAFSISVLILGCDSFIILDTTTNKLNAVRFNWLLKVGMSQLEETTAENQTHADLHGTLTTSTIPLYDKKGIKFIWFTSWGGPCLEGGPVFVLQFDNSNRLRSWYEDQWTDGC